MKRFQFSVSGLFVLTFLVAIVLSLRGGLESEWSLETIWIVVFLLSYWKSPEAGRRQVVRAAATTGVIWGVLVLCLYAWLLNRKGAPSAVELALHGAVVVLAVVLLAVAAAWFVEGIRAAVRFWLRRGSAPRVLLALAAVGSVSLVAVAWTNLQSSYWEPASMTSAQEAFEEGFPWLRHGPQSPSGKYFGLVIGSLDGRFAAATLDVSQKVQVFDLASEELLASFSTAGDEWFSDLTFHPDGSRLAALAHSKTAGLKLVEWDVPDWTPREPIPLDHLVDGDRPGECRYVALDRCLLVVRARAIDRHTCRVEISTVDLLDERLSPRPFASGKIESVGSLHGAGLSRIVDPRGWMVSPSGKWISGAGDYLFCAGAAPIRLRGRAIGFFRDADCLVVHERTVGFYWRGEQPTAIVAPFWNYLRVDARYRVTLYHCGRQQVAARSRWFTDFGEPHMTPDRSQLLAERGDSVLIWEFPESSRVKRTASNGAFHAPYGSAGKGPSTE